MTRTQNGFQRIGEPDIYDLRESPGSAGGFSGVNTEATEEDTKSTEENPK